MNPSSVLAHFDLISDTPDAIPRLRQFILELAVRGKLATQDTSDQPASELFKRIQATRSRFVKEGKVKERPPQTPISGGDIDYDLPKNWFATRIGDLLTVIRGASPRPKGDPKYFSGHRTQYHWIKISDIRKHSREGILYDTDEFLTLAGMEKSVLLPKGTLIVTNSATIGVPIILGFEGGCIHDGYLAFPYFPEPDLSKSFFFILFQTLQSHAAKMARGMAQLNLNTELVREFPMGLPPAAEQQRIVAKVNELMTLCDRLQGACHEQERQRERAAFSALHRLSNGASPSEFEKCSRFYLDHIVNFTARPSHIPELRRAILSLAIRGKLVPQDVNDEQASDLVKRIHADKQRRIAAGKLRKEKPLPAIAADQVPFAIPDNWTWVRIGACALMTEYGTSVRSDEHEEGVPVLAMGDIQDAAVILSTRKKVPRKIEDLPQLFLKRFDLLYNRTNSAELVGKTGIYLVTTTPTLSLHTSFGLASIETLSTRFT